MLLKADVGFGASALGNEKLGVCEGGAVDCDVGPGVGPTLDIREPPGVPEGGISGCCDCVAAGVKEKGEDTAVVPDPALVRAAFVDAGWGVNVVGGAKDTEGLAC